MSRAFLTPIDLGQNELQNGVIQNLGTAPAAPAPKKGQVYFNSGDNTLYWFDGTTWQSAKGGAIPDGDKGDITITGGVWTIDTGAVTSAKVADGTLVTGDLDLTSVRLDTIGAPTAFVAMNTQRITGMGTPSASTDAATKGYVDGLIQGLDAKNSVKAASTANNARSGLTAVDGYTPVANDRILLKDQTAPAENGIYLASSGGWSRATDMDTWTEVPSAYVWVEGGSTNADTGWITTADSGGTIGATAMPWTQFSGAGQVVAGAGLTKTGNTLDVVAGTGITVAADLVSLDTAFTDGRYIDNTEILGYVPTSRTISTTAPITGGGDLSANRTIAITSFAGAAAGAVPVSVGGTTNFLRADGTWAAPAGGGTVNKQAYDVGGSTAVVINHTLNTRDVLVELYRNSTPWDTVEADIERTSTSQVTFRFAVAPAAAAYRAVLTA